MLDREAMIMSGLRIGHGPVGARTVVSRDVPRYAVVAGDPARIVRFRLESAIVERLLQIAWWEWDDATIAKYMPLILQDDIELFLTSAKNGEVTP